MFSPCDQQAVMSGLGDKFLNGLAWSVRGAREDLAELREWKPAWFPPMSGRCLANLIHDRIWARLVVSVEGNPDIETIDREPVREAAALEFWAQGSQLPSLEAITLGADYRWIAEERRVGPAVVSYRDGKDNPIWVVELDEPDEGKDIIGWRPITWPDLPAVDLFNATRIDERGEGGSSS